VAHMQARGINEIVSYDRGFDGVPGVTRVEP
jgi:predicted nucleic acid-binding protein